MHFIPKYDIFIIGVLAVLDVAAVAMLMFLQSNQSVSFRCGIARMLFDRYEEATIGEKADYVQMTAPYVNFCSYSIVYICTIALLVRIVCCAVRNIKSTEVPPSNHNHEHAEVDSLKFKEDCHHEDNDKRVEQRPHEKNDNTSNGQMEQNNRNCDKKILDYYLPLPPTQTIHPSSEKKSFNMGCPTINNGSLCNYNKCIFQPENYPDMSIEKIREIKRRLKANLRQPTIKKEQDDNNDTS